MERKVVRESEEIVLLKETEEELEEDDEEEEALSLCDLPNDEENQTKKEASGVSELVQEDFDFGGNLLMKESEMCTADEVFYQGQILPLRHSISLPNDSRNSSTIRFMSRSESMEEHCHDTNSSSRSSSIRSQRSSSSGSSSNISTPICSKYKPRIRNQFHSHPSPTPQVRFSKVVQSNVNNSSRKSTLWSLFRVGLVTTPEIALQDLKSRSNKDYSGSRNSTSSSSSGMSNYDNKMRSIILSKKKKQRFFLGSCKCSANAVETVPSNVVIMNRNGIITKTRKATEVHEHEDKKDVTENMKVTKKQSMSRHRTFEWLKQLSLEGPADEI